MKKEIYIIFAIMLALIYSCEQSSQNNSSEFFLPAEWEPQSGVIFGGLDDPVNFEMVSHLAKESKVYCFVVDSAEESFRNKFLALGLNLDSIQFLTSPVDFTYALRDGVMFMKNGNGDKQLVNFDWNMYGWYFVPEFENYMEYDIKNRKLYDSIHFDAFPYPVITSSMVNEGGAIETNGKGTILQVESLNMHRNPEMSLESQEAELKRVLNAKKIIWLKEGVAEDPSGWGTLITENYFGVGVNGHLDEFCRFVNENTILISFPDSAEAANDPVKKITLDRMKVNYEILKNATDQDGNPFTIVKMPVPEVEYLTFSIDTVSMDDEVRFLSQQILWEQKSFSQGDTVHFVPSSSYLNFLITNNTVFESKYWTEGRPESAKAKDEKAKEILQHYFPDKEIYQINTEATNHNGGGMHCWTMQVPK